MTVKTDRNDAQGLAQIVRTGWFKAVHLKSVAGQRLRTLTAARKAAVRAVTASEQVIRGLLRPLGLKIGAVTRVPADSLPFTTYGVSPQRDGILLGFSASTAVADATNLFIRYEGTMSGQDSNHALTAGVRITW